MGLISMQILVEVN